MNQTATAHQRLRRVFAVLGAVGLCASCRGSAQMEAACEFPESSESVITFHRSARQDSSLVGRVVDANLNPLRDARVSIEPSGLGALSDNAGRFQFVGLPRGRYHLSVELIGYQSASDSITLSEFGVRVAAVLVELNLGHPACIIGDRRFFQTGRYGNSTVR